MAAKFEIGQEVIIRSVRNQHLSPRDSDLELYAGQIGKVTDYHWISPSTGVKVFYIYTVQVGTSNKEIVLHEDELEACVG